MGKVLEKLKALPIVKSIDDVKGQHMVVLNNGLEKLCNSAHEARLFIQEHTPKALSRATASRSSAPSTPTSTDGDAGPVVQNFVPEIRCAKYPGLPDEMRKPIWEWPKGFEITSLEGKDAYLRGFERKSHYRGESQSAKDFEVAWDSARREAEAAQTK